MKRLLIYITLGIWGATTICSVAMPNQERKARVRMQFEYYKTVQKEYLTIRVSGRPERRYEPIEEIGVSFYLGDPEENIFLGKITTDADGFGELGLPPVYYEASDTLNEIHFNAVLDSSPVYEDKTSELIIKKPEFDIEYVDNDSIKTIQVNIAETDSADVLIPQHRVEVKFFVERPLGYLPIGGDFNITDEEGNISINFPNDLPGDSLGNVTLIVRIEDNDKYGNIEKKKVLDWGIPTRMNDESIERSLWASGANAPIPLLILVNSLIAIVWGIIFYIIYRIYRISKV